MESVVKKKYIFLSLSLAILTYSGCANQAYLDSPQYTILGGPRNGSFIYFAEEISKLAREQNLNLRHKSTQCCLIVYQ